MKNTLRSLSLSLLLSVSFLYTNAQSLQLSDLNGQIVNGQEMFAYRDPADPGNTLIEGDVLVTNISNASKDVKVKRRVISVVSGSTNYFCWTICYGPSQNQSPTAETIAPNTTNSKFHGYCDAYGAGGTSTIMYIFFDSNNPTDSSYVTINYVDGKFTGLAGISGKGNVSAIYPNPAKDFARIKVDGYENQQIKAEVYNVLGSKVYVAEMDRNKNYIQLNLTSLPPGVYFYNVTANDKTVTSRKLVIE